MLTPSPRENQFGFRSLWSLVRLSATLALLGCGRSELATPLPAPRAIAPHSTARVTSQRPRFRWALPANARGARVELCRDPNCATVVRTVEAVGDTVQLSQPLDRGTWFWRVRAVARGLASEASTPPWELFVEGRDVEVSAVTGGWMDFDRDGRIDIVAWRGDRRNPRLDVHLGRDGPPSSAPSAVIEGLAPLLDGDGPYVTLDVNGDGFGDLLVPWSDGHGGRLPSVLLGGPDGLTTARRWDVPIVGDSMLYDRAIAVGDVDGDGYGDIAYDTIASNWQSGPHLYLHVARGGGSGFTESEIIGFPIGINDTDSVVPPGVVGDFDGDGLNDVLLASRSPPAGGEDCGIGRGYLWRGGSAGLASDPVTIVSDPGSPTLGDPALFGGATDVNGDGYPDLMVGACRSIDFISPAEFDGSASGLPGAPSRRFGGRFDGQPVAIGDVNADGFGDVVAREGGTGRDTTVMVFEGGPEGITMPPIASVAVKGEDFGVRAVGDVDGDGFDDVMVALLAADPPSTLFCRGGAAATLSCDVVFEGSVP